MKTSEKLLQAGLSCVCDDVSTGVSTTGLTLDGSYQWVFYVLYIQDIGSIFSITLNISLSKNT